MVECTQADGRITVANTRFVATANSKTRTPLVLLLTGSIILVTACASDEGWVNFEPEPLTAENFSAQGNQICSELAAEVDAIVAEASGDDGFLDLEAYQLLDDTRDAAFAELFVLQPPAEFEEDFQTLKDVREEFAEAANERIPEPDISERLGPQWDAAATNLNLTDCIG